MRCYDNMRKFLFIKGQFFFVGHACQAVLRIRLCRDPANVSTLFGLGTNWKEPEFVNIVIRIVVRWPNGPAAGIWE